MIFFRHRNYNGYRQYLVGTYYVMRVEFMLFIGRLRVSPMMQIVLELYDTNDIQVKYGTLFTIVLQMQNNKYKIFDLYDQFTPVNCL